ncbi:MAG: transcriptional repressor LexA [Legionellales bacterium]|nr:transcriptional repressor LexA [Legionellales bacterium]
MLTEAQRRTYHFILNFFDTHHKSPTLPEIAQGIGIKSRGVVHRYLQALIQEGLIKSLPRRHRGIMLVEQSTQPISIQLPFIGQIAAGSPIEAIAQQETIDVTQFLQKPNLYVLKVKGNSMINEGIFNDDLVICESSQQAKNGDIVVALIDNQDATLKRIHYNADNTITLIPANSELSPITYAASRVSVQGIFVGLLRLAS